VIKHNRECFDETVLFAVALLIFTTSAHAAAPAPLSDACMEPAQTDGHQVNTWCSLRSYQEWRKDGKLDRADGPAIILRDPMTGDVTFEAWRKDGQPIEPPSRIIAK
jgi:hypothetical protein